MAMNNKEQIKWLTVGILAIVFIGIIVHHFSNTPVATRANKIDFVPLTQQRDLSTPSSRLVGHWINVEYGDEVYFSPIDPDLKIGNYRLGNKSKGRVSPPLRFKVISENPAGLQLVIRQYDQNEETRKLGARIGMDFWQSDVTYTISKNGQSMTAEYIFSGSQILSVYRYVDDKTSP